MKSHLISSVVTAGLLIAGHSSAGTMGPLTSQSTWSWVGTVSAGPAWSRGGSLQTFYLDPDIERTYAPHKSTHSLTSGEIFAGVQRRLSTSSWLGQLGLAAGAAGNARLQGEIWDDADDEFYNYQYHYKIRHTRVALKGKLLLDRYSSLIPWVSASAGVGFNRTRGFSNAPLLFEAPLIPNFKNHTKTTFTYTLGAGVQTAISTHWQAGVGYEFADWGKSELSRCLGQTMNTGLTLNHLYSNGVLFNLAYIA